MTLTLKRKPERTDASFRWTVPRVHIWDSGAHLSVTYTVLMESLLLGWWCQNLGTRKWWMWIQVERTDGCCRGRKDSVIFKVGGKDMPSHEARQGCPGETAFWGSALRDGKVVMCPSGWRRWFSVMRDKGEHPCWLEGKAGHGSSTCFFGRRKAAVHSIMHT